MTTFRQRKIYVASSWRNKYQPCVVENLREAGHLVYDFRHPSPEDNGFHWTEIDPEWETWTVERYRELLNHPIAERGYKTDLSAMKWADTFVLVLPCGRSAHLELGWACGQGKETFILLDQVEPELMNKMADYLCATVNEVLKVIGSL